MEEYKKIFIYRGSITRGYHTVETLFYRWRHWRHFKIIFIFYNGDLRNCSNICIIFGYSTYEGIKWNY